MGMAEKILHRPNQENSAQCCFLFAVSAVCTNSVNKRFRILSAQDDRQTRLVPQTIWFMILLNERPHPNLGAEKFNPDTRSQCVKHDALIATSAKCVLWLLLRCDAVSCVKKQHLVNELSYFMEIYSSINTSKATNSSKYLISSSALTVTLAPVSTSSMATSCSVKGSGGPPTSEPP